MSQKTKSRAGCHQATPSTLKSTFHSSVLSGRIKGIVVTLALWGLLPVGVASWLIQKGGLRDE